MNIYIKFQGEYFEHKIKEIKKKARFFSFLS